MTTLRMELADKSYDIKVGRGLLAKAGENLNLSRRVLIVTDSGVPKDYAEALLGACKEGKIITVAEGEGSKSMQTLGEVLTEMSSFGLTRHDCAVAVGGGVVGDLVGFASSIYMRGIDFYNVPSTVLSMVDSSIGGKTAVNFLGIKNIIGSFYQPKAVLIDTDVLKTLPKRQISSGLAEAVKMAVTMDAELFSDLEKMSYDEIMENIETIIIRSLKIKKAVVEKDERESSLRKVLNFGHTLGHGIEAVTEMQLLHGECVSLGMIPMCSDEVKPRLAALLEKLSLPCSFFGDLDGALEFLSHDKKCDGDKVTAILCDEIGSFRMADMELSEFYEKVKNQVQ